MADAAPARPSSTVVLLRDRDGPPEVLMVRRHPDASFGATYVFPGGVLEPQDNEVWEHCAGITSDQAGALLDSADALDYFSSAIRELFEETGVLLADRAPDLDLESARAALNAGALDWTSFVGHNRLSLRCDALTYFGYWITPDEHPKRYQTRFFLADLPRGQEASPCGAELTDSVWLTAREALAANRANKMMMPFPTLSTVRMLSQFASHEDIHDWCSTRQSEGVPCVYPRIVDGRVVIQ